MTIRTLLVDDERLGRARLRQMLEVEPDLEILGEYADGRTAVEAITELHPDLVFLDIEMPGGTGFEVLDRLPPDSVPLIIFVTAYPEHGAQAFDTGALDYLVKPIEAPRLAKAVSRARARLAAAASAPGETAGNLVIRSRGLVAVVPIAEIGWIEAAGNYAVVHVGPETHLMRETLNTLEKKLSTQGFTRLNRGAIVNLRQIKELQSTPEGEHTAVLKTGERLPMTRHFREIADLLETT